MQKEQSEIVMTPEEERELKFPVREEQPSSWNFTPVQIVILFLQFCLVGVFLGAVISNDTEQKHDTSPRKIVVVTVERERKAGGGFKYRLVAGKKGGVEALIMENFPSDEQLATIETVEADEQTTAIRWMTTPDPPLKIITPKIKVTSSPLLGIAKDAPMPSPPVPPPLSTVTSSGGKNLKSTKKTSSTKAPFKFSYHRNDFFRG